MKNLRKFPIGILIVPFIYSLSCKRGEEQISATKLAKPTHTLSVSFVEETSKIEYKLIGEGAENETVTAVKIVQNKREKVAQWLKEKITAGYLSFATVQGDGYYPDYLLEVKTTNFTCTNQKGAYIGVKDNPVWCGKSGSSTTTTAGAEAKPDENTGTEKPKPQGAAATTKAPANGVTSINSGPKKTIPNPPKVCAGPSVKAYKVCRFFEGGAVGCYFKLDRNCLVPMTPAVCKMEKDLLTMEYKNTVSFQSSWDCSLGVK